MTPTPIEFAGAEGNRLAGDLWDGRGHPVLFLHGGGQTRRAWDATARRVADNGMRAITVDLRGHGESDWVDSGNYTFADFGADAAAIIRQTASRFHAAPSAVGASLGGLSSLIAETRFGPLLDSLVLVDITPRMDPDGVAKIQGFMGERMEEGFATLDEAADAIAEYLPNRKRPRSLEGLKKNLRLGDDGRYRWHWDPAFMRSERNINLAARETMEELIANLPNLHVPALLVRGMQSELVHEDFAREFVELAPSASYVDVGGAGHMVAGDKNDVFCAAILDFLTDREAA
ncbi:alpha/beta hydrolase [Mesorhizobium microcysteis]|uniref:Alpha/beta hydrolase n=1 Tax=Neoaquamicrobium microcysteis TaxID=2682781 RepID=A0A5D4GRV8_9HYPH|nr:alpha/beta hydrolase [Mesorhizobium microcysteis]TYR31107.1 alpha/beta hydrolase [Mesorhizobium microcysteis]